MDQKRKKIGIIFNFRSVWMGGIIYILNLIRMLDFLDDNEKPEITVFYNSDLKKFVDEIKYPYFSSMEWEFPPIMSGYIKSWLTGKNVFINRILVENELDGLYPMHDYPVRMTSETRLVSWYADLQHKYYPEFFRGGKLWNGQPE